MLSILYTVFCSTKHYLPPTSLRKLPMLLEVFMESLEFGNRVPLRLLSVLPWKSWTWRFSILSCKIFGSTGAFWSIFELSGLWTLDSVFSVSNSKDENEELSFSGKLCTNVGRQTRALSAVHGNSDCSRACKFLLPCNFGKLWFDWWLGSSGWKFCMFREEVLL